MAQDPLCLLVVEPYFPGRLGAVADWLVRRRGYRVHFYCHQAEDPALWPETVNKGLELVQFNVGGVAREPSVPWVKGLERGLCYAYGAWEVFDGRRPRPVDLILGRSAGLGSNLFASVSYPGVPRINYFDYYYRPHLYDLAGEAGPEMPAEYFLWRRAANAMDLLDLENDSTAWVPTAWQRDLYPEEYQNEFTIQYEGVDARRFARPAERPRQLLGRTLDPETRIVSFAAGAPDQLRGLERFVALSNRLLRAREDVVCVVAGGGAVSRMLDVEHHAQNYLAKCLADDPPHDPDRFWMPGLLAPSSMADLLGATDLHVDPSRPYIVARTMVEAMSSGAVVLAWDSEPVREFLHHEKTGLLVDPADLDAAEAMAMRVLDDPAAFRPIGDAAASLVRESFSQDVCLPKLTTLFEGLMRPV